MWYVKWLEVRIIIIIKNDTITNSCWGT